MKHLINWKAFVILLLLSLLSIVAVFPYVITVQGELLQQTGISLKLIFLVQFVQSLIIFSIAQFLGLFFIKKTHFELPLIEAMIEKRNYQEIFKRIIGISTLSGVVVAVTIYMIDFFFSYFGVGITTHQSIAPVWQTMLAALYGGIAEEILMRLFLMSGLIWLSMKVFRQDQPTKIAIILSIFSAAIVFGLGHLPITSVLTEITLLVLIRAIVLNGIGGVVFGWLFWKKGLESAMIAHFTTDFILLTLLPQLFK